MARDNEILERLDEVERNQVRLASEIEQLRRELQAHGLTVLPEINPAGRTPLSREARVAQLQRAAALARLAKQLGEGRGRIRNPETAERVRREAAAVLQVAAQLANSDPATGNQDGEEEGKS